MNLGISYPLQSADLVVDSIQRGVSGTAILDSLKIKSPDTSVLDVIPNNDLGSLEGQE